MGTVIIGIHGLSNKPSPEVLQKGWEDAILEGLQKNAKLRIRRLNFISVYWADVMYSQYDDKADLYHPAKEGSLKRYKECWLDELRIKGLEICGDVLDNFKKLYGIDRVAEKVLSAKLKDLHIYYNDKEKQKVLRDRLEKEIINNRDKRDPVAIDTHISNDYESDAYGVKVRDDLVLNDWGGLNHKSYGYLRTAEFTDELKRFL